MLPSIGPKVVGRENLNAFRSIAQGWKPGPQELNVVQGQAQGWGQHYLGKAEEGPRILEAPASAVALGLGKKAKRDDGNPFLLEALVEVAKR